VRTFSYIGWLALIAYLCTGCKQDTPVDHKFCVLSLPTKVGDERYTCTVTARFESADACHTWEEIQRQKDPAPYKDGRLNTKCGTN
jgi:hypothetical protein